MTERFLAANIPIQKFWASGVLALCLMAAGPAASAPARSASLEGPQPQRVEVPAPLAGWAEWVLQGRERELCPRLPSSGGSRVCVWPSSLTLALEETGGRFDLLAETFAPMFLALPGSLQSWPTAVSVDGAPTPVIDHGDAPAVFLARGHHHVEGAFDWRRLPARLSVPSSVGLVSLSILGKRVLAPTYEQPGVLSLQSNAGAQGGTAGDPAGIPPETDAIELAVDRKLIDALPLQMITHLRIGVSGGQREVVVGPVLPQGFVPMSLESPLPARLDASGLLTVQAKPGDFAIEIAARWEGPSGSTELSMPRGEHWVDQETWSFESRPNLRQVRITGAEAVDPSQTSLPDSWKSFAAYRVTQDTRFAIEEVHRGQSASDRLGEALSLRRQVWLDFDGRGFSVQDWISGRLRQNRRLTAPPELALGRAELDGRENLLITRLAEESGAGVELRAGKLLLVAESRLDKSGAHALPLGWNQAFQSATVNLELPPGWRLLAVTGLGGGVGVGAATGWVARWDLLGLFLLLLTTLATSRLFGRVAGAVAFATMVLVIPESALLAWLALVLVACEGCARLFAKTRAGAFFSALRWGARIALILTMGNFALGQLQEGVHPVLEQPWHTFGQQSGGEASRRAAKAARSARPALFDLEEDVSMAAEFFQSANALSADDESAQKGKASGMSRRKSIQKQERFDPVDAVQTGAGLPSWTWTSHALRFEGPVEAGSEIRFWLVPPMLHRALALARVILCALLFFFLCGLNRRGWPGRRADGDRGEGENHAPASSARVQGAARALSIALALLAALPSAAWAAEASAIPSQALLDDLRARLLAEAACAPECASVDRLALDFDAAASELRARLEIHAVDRAVVALPRIDGLAFPSAVRLNGAQAPLLRDTQGALWLYVPKGIHQVEMAGAIPARAPFQVLLPEAPHHLNLSAEGFTVDGVRPDGLPRPVLHVARSPAQGSPQGTAPMPTVGSDEQGWKSEFPPLFRVTRTLRLGLTWQVETTVERLTPLGSGAVLDVPLLPGEQVITENVQASDGRVRVNLGPQASSFSWRASLANAETLTLRSPDNRQSFEVWQLDVGRVWNVAWEGVPLLAVDEGASSGELSDQLAVFQPLPGESLQLRILRPGAIAGQTLTLESSSLTVTPGARQLKASLDLQWSASRGHSHTLRLPAQARLQNVRIDGEELPLRLEADGRMTLPLAPGKTSVRVEWLQPHEMSPLFRMPEVDLGVPGVNSSARIDASKDRWVLFAGGAPVGPVIRFWSLFLGLALLSLVLWRFGRTPLGWVGWFLLLIGLSVIEDSVRAMVLTVGWLLFLGYRRRTPDRSKGRFNLRQIGLGIWTVVALVVLIIAVSGGLLGAPEMQISGNGSSGWDLRFFTDRSEATLMRPWLVSVPMVAYKVAMLLWALWLAFALLGWLRWGWRCFNEGGIWKPGTPSAPKATPAPAPQPQPKAAEAAPRAPSEAAILKTEEKQEKVS